MLMWYCLGLFIGLSLAVPIGPVGLLCIHQTLEKNRLTAFLVSLGASFADSLYGSIVAFNLDKISGYLLTYQTLLKGIGGLLLIILGYRALSQSSLKKDINQNISLIKGFTTSFSLTFTNPATLIVIVSILALYGIDQKRSSLDSTTLVLGIFSGSSLWWFLLSFYTHKGKEKFSQNRLNRLNQFSALLLLGAGILILLFALYHDVSR
jgi:threonine/homoserine/homoserine lactone efflux protein